MITNKLQKVTNTMKKGLYNMTKHKFLVASTLFDVTFDEQFKALKFVAKEDIRVDTSVKTGVISVSEHNYVFMHPIANSPLITAPVDSGYIGDITIISSRPITLPKGYTFFLMELRKSDNNRALPKDMKLRDPAYKGDIGRDCYLKKSAKRKKDVQFMLQNINGHIFFPRSSAAKKGYEVWVNSETTTIRKSDLSLLTNEEAYSVVQMVDANVVKYVEEVEFVTPEDAELMISALSKKSDRGSKKEGSSDNGKN